MILTIFVSKTERWLACMSAPLPPLGLSDLANKITEQPCNIWYKLLHTQKKTPHSLFIQNSNLFYLASLFTMQALWAEFENDTDFTGSLSSVCPLSLPPPPSLPFFPSSLPLSYRIAFDFILYAGFTCAHVSKNSTYPKENTVYTYGCIHRSLRWETFWNA